LDIRAIASSEDSERLGRSYGIPFVNFEECRSLDLTIDGADEIAPKLALTKGGGGNFYAKRLSPAHRSASLSLPTNRNKWRSLDDFPCQLK
jgi:ribose 5-phosphate isomerase A